MIEKKATMAAIFINSLKLGITDRPIRPVLPILKCNIASSRKNPNVTKRFIFVANDEVVSFVFVMMFITMFVRIFNAYNINTDYLYCSSC